MSDEKEDRATKPRSFRMSDEQWAPARARAQKEGKTMSSVIAMLVEGYGSGMIDLPQVQLVYPAPSSQG